MNVLSTEVDRAKRLFGRPTLLAVAACTLALGSASALAHPASTGGSGSAAAPERVRVMNTLPRFRLRTQAGQPFGTNALENKVWIATFIFTRCGATCPAQTAQFVKLQAELAADPALADVHLISITVDPTHDRPEVLQAYAEKFGADPERWTFLTGKKPEVLGLCKDGFKLPVSEATESGPIAHSQNFVIVDRARRVRGYYDGLNEEAVDQLRHDLRLVLNDPPGMPTTTRPTYFDDDRESNDVYVPREVEDVPWLEDAEAAQQATLDEFRVFHGFTFTDQLPASGIDFVHKVVDDATIDYKAVHYDHGNGIAIADVDGDGLLDAYFVTQVGSNELWRNVGGGKFEDITEAAGVGVGDRISVTASFADIDNDGDADLYVTSVRGGNVMLANDGTGRFEDITESSGLGHVEHCSSAVFFDYDNDGLLDLFLTVVGVYTSNSQGRAGYYVGLLDAFAGQTQSGRTRRSLLFHNDGENKFTEVSKAMGLVDKSWTGAASPVDFNRDGWQDLYVLSMQGHDEYYENVGGEKFVNKSREIFPRTPWGSMGIKVFDFDNDGLLDIFITDMHTDMVDDSLAARRNWYADKMKMTDMYPKQILKTDNNHVLGNAFFHNRGDGQFREISDEIGAENYWPWGHSVGDLNADGYEDVFITASMNYPFRYAVNSVLLNDLGERFLDSEFILGVEPRRERRTSKPWFTLDCDGEDKDHGACEGRTGEVVVHAALGSRSSALFDLDGDGDLDIVTNEFHDVPMVLISDLSARKSDIHWLQLDLVGTTSNRDALGARIHLKAGDLSITKVQDGISGYLSQSRMPLYFGLGAAQAAESISITWPSGKTQVVEGPIAANQVLTIVEE